MKRMKRTRGSAMVEFAIGSGVLVTIFTGTFQFGYTFLQYNTLENAVAEAAHYGSLQQYFSTSPTPTTAYSTAVKNMVVYGSPTAGTTPLLNGLSTSNVSVTITPGAGYNNGSGQFTPAAVTVAISSYTINGFFSTQTVTNKPQVTYAYTGLYQP